MDLILATPGTTPGPTWASMLNTALTTIDAHDHTSGNGVLVPTAGLNINADLPLNGYALNSALILRLTNQVSTPVDALDLRAIYAKNGELAYIDGAGNEVVLTSNGSIAGATGSISGLSSPASGQLDGITNVFSIAYDTGKPAKTATSDIKLYEYDNASANPITLKSPASLGSAYTWTLPSAQASNAVELLTTNNSGQLDTALLAGTANQITVTQSLSSVVLSLPSAVTMPGSLTTTTTLTVGTILKIANGTVSAPGLAFSSDTDTGLYFTTDGVNIAGNGTRVAGFTLGGAYILGPIVASSGSLAEPTYSFVNDSDTGMFLSATGTLAFATGGGSRGTFTSAGLSVTGAITATTTIAATGALSGASLNLDSGGAFKAKLFSGTFSSGIITLSAGSQVYGVMGYHDAGAGQWITISQQDYGTGSPYFGQTDPDDPEKVILVRNGISSSLAYKVIVFYT